MNVDEITLRLPRERQFFRVAHLVLGGLAVRLDLSFEQLEDLQVALAEVLEQHESEEEVTVTLRVKEGTFEASLGPLDESLTKELSREEPEGRVGLRRVLETVVDSVSVTERDGRPWIELTKAVKQTAEKAG